MLELAYRPFRLAPVAVVFLLIATVMSKEQQRLVAIGFAVVGVGFVAGAALQVITHHPLVLERLALDRARRISGVSLVQHRDECA